MNINKANSYEINPNRYIKHRVVSILMSLMYFFQSVTAVAQEDPNQNVGIGKDFHSSVKRLKQYLEPKYGRLREVTREDKVTQGSKSTAIYFRGAIVSPKISTVRLRTCM
jgi:hypothetical protein